MNEPRLTKVIPNDDHTLLLHYETGEIKLFDVKPYIRGTFLGQLQEPAYFKTVQIFPNGKGLKWKNGQDLAPHELYETSVPINKQKKHYD